MTQFTARKQQAFLDALARTGVVLTACKEVNISRDTAYRYRNSDPEFAAQWDTADESFTDVLEAKAHQLALRDGKETSLWNLLRSRRPSKYREPVQRFASTDSDGNDKPELTDEERAARTIAILDRARARRDGQPDSSSEDVGTPPGATD